MATAGFIRVLSGWAALLLSSAYWRRVGVPTGAEHCATHRGGPIGLLRYCPLDWDSTDEMHTVRIGGVDATFRLRVKEG